MCGTASSSTPRRWLRFSPAVGRGRRGQRPAGGGELGGHPVDVLGDRRVRGEFFNEGGDLVLVDRVVARLMGGNLAHHLLDLVLGQRCALQQRQQRYSVGHWND